MSTLRQYSLGFGATVGGLFTRANLRALFLLWLPVFLASAFLGLCSVILPWWLCMGLAGAVGYLALLWLFPWLGLGAYIVIVLAAPDFKIADVATMVTMAVMVLRLVMHGQLAPPFPRRLRSAAWWFFAVVALSFALGIVYFHNSAPSMYRDGRAFVYWLWLPILWRMTAGQAEPLQKLMRVLIGIAYTVAALALFQWVTGIQVVSGLVASLDSSGAGKNVTRVQMPGFLFVSLAIIWLSLQMLYRRVPVLIGALAMLPLLAALYVNFGRGLWIWTFIGVLIPLMFIGGGRAFKLLATLVAGAVLVAGTLALVKPAVIENISERLVSVKNEGGRRTSYGWRELENQEAIRTLKHSPVFGVGMGGEYRPWLHELRLFAEHVRYIHNTYFFLAVKLGIPGLLCFLLFFWRAWNGARQGLAAVEESNRVTLLAGLSFFPACMGLSITQPEIVSPHSVVLFAALITIFASYSAPEVKAVSPRRKGTA
ncbi:hypothetical protein GTP38_19355 [Duganella sp. FT94W]|uniref:O-antigen ligase-related domain-containing protein n=1 Tax=Duganella lactea TaxID=2692173 RepID=A0ABW9VCU9_9BURK|nr:O-antigen ligase family protein [Duganella lactea]MYM36489.1 hypothetical protein [Duganella lactea]